jgi:hypothetical protein
MHRTRHNVKIGNKKKQEKTSRKCVSCNPSSLPNKAYTPIHPPPSAGLISKQSAQLHTNGIKIGFNITFEIKSQHLTKKIKLHGLSYPNRWVGCVGLEESIVFIIQMKEVITQGSE